MRLSPKPAWAVRAVAVVCCALLAACSGASGGQPQPPAPATDGAQIPAAAVARYGQAVPKHADGFTYQPDVLVIGGGAGVVRSVSGDGLEWTIDHRADGIDDLAVGQVMALTSRAVGRVASIQRSGPNVRVLLAPVQLSEVIRDGRIKLDTQVNPEDMVIQEIPDTPGAVSQPGQAESDLPEASMDRSGGGRASGPLPAPQPHGEAEVTIGEWEGNVGLDKEGLTLQLSAKPNDNFKAGVETTIGMNDLRLIADATFESGRLLADQTLLIAGVKYLDLKLQAGTAHGSKDNRKIKIEFPAELNQPYPIAGIPFVVIFKVKIFVILAMSGNNSRLTASGRWGLDGPIGFQAGHPVLPRFSVTNSLMRSIEGIVLGPSGIVVGSEFKLMLGLGVPGIAGGVYGKLRSSVGIAKGSALLTPWINCLQTTMRLEGGGGVGISADARKLAALLNRTKKWPVKLELEYEWMGDIKKETQTLPKRVVCGA